MNSNQANDAFQKMVASVKRNPWPAAAVGAGVLLVGGWLLFRPKKGDSSTDSDGKRATVVDNPGSGSSSASLPPPPVALPGKLLPAEGGRIVIAAPASFSPVVDEVAAVLPHHEVFGVYHPDGEPLVGVLDKYGVAPQANVFVLLDGWSDPADESALVGAEAMLTFPRANQMRLALMPPAFQDAADHQTSWFQKLKACEKGRACFGLLPLTLPQDIALEDTPQATFSAVTRAMGQNLAAKLLEGAALLEERAAARYSCGRGLVPSAPWRTVSAGRNGVAFTMARSAAARSVGDSSSSAAPSSHPQMGQRER